MAAFPYENSLSFRRAQIAIGQCYVDVDVASGNNLVDTAGRSVAAVHCFVNRTHHLAERRALVLGIL